MTTKTANNKAKNNNATNNAANSVDAMLAAAQQQNTVVEAAQTTQTTKFARSSAFDENGNARQRRNYEVKQRNIVVFSNADKQAFISTNLAFTAKSASAAIAHLKRATQKSLADFIKTDFTVETKCADVSVGDNLKAAQAKLHDELVEAGYTVLSKRPAV